MGQNRLMTAAEVAEELGVSKSKAYKIVHQMNKELQEKGFYVVVGRVNRRYFRESFYGMADTEQGA